MDVICGRRRPHRLQKLAAREHGAGLVVHFGMGVVHHKHAVCHAADVLHTVGDEQNGIAALTVIFGDLR